MKWIMKPRKKRQTVNWRHERRLNAVNEAATEARKMAVGARMNEMNVGARKTKLNEWLMK